MGGDVVTIDEELRLARRQLVSANLKLGEARKVVREFWARTGAADPYNRETSWAMHVAMVRLDQALAKSTSPRAPGDEGEMT
jgi:hypothetical protein